MTTVYNDRMKIADENFSSYQSHTFRCNVFFFFSLIHNQNTKTIIWALFFFFGDYGLTNEICRTDFGISLVLAFLTMWNEIPFK